jgi:hypothetical protein
MSEGVSILLSADDQASKEFTKVGNNLGAIGDQATQILAGMEETAKDLHAELAALAEQHKAGALSAEQYAAAQADVLDLLAQNVSQTKAFNADLQKAASIVNAAKTTTERYNEELMELARLHKSGALTADQFAKLEGTLKTKINETSEAFRQQQSDAQKAAAVINALKSPLERQNEELEELVRLQKAGHLSSEQFTAAQSRLGGKLQSTGGSIKDVGGKAKVATELFGTLANVAGGSELSGFAGQLAGLTDKVGQFSEVAKAGGAGATIFKAGLIAATAYVSFNVGKYIGDWWYETEKLKKEMEAVGKKTEESMELFRKFQSQAREDRKFDIDIIKNPEAKKQAIKDLTKTLEDELARQETALKNQRKVTQESADAQSWNYIGNDITENRAKQDEEEIKRIEERTKALGEEVTELRRSTNAEQERRDAIIAKIAAEEQWQSLIDAERQKNIDERIKEAEEENRQYQEQVKIAGEQLAAERLNTIDERTAEAKAAHEEYMAEVKALEDSRKASVDARIEEAKAANEEHEAEKEKIEEIIKGEKERIELRKIALEQGEAAAKQKQLEMQGVDSSTAANLVAQDEALSQREKEQENAKKMGEATTNTASESRLLTRGPSQDNGVALLKTNEQMLKEMQESRKEAAEARREARQKSKQVKLELVS